MDITMMSPNSSSASPFMPPVTHAEEKVRKYSKPPPCTGGGFFYFSVAWAISASVSAVVYFPYTWESIFEM